MFRVSGVSYSGMDDAGEFLVDGSLEQARCFAHNEVLAQMGQFTAWVQGQGINECHAEQEGSCTVCHPKQAQEWLCKGCSQFVSSGERCPGCGIAQEEQERENAAAKNGL